jgi:hypothetical protein
MCVTKSCVRDRAGGRRRRRTGYRTKTKNPMLKDVGKNINKKDFCWRYVFLPRDPMEPTHIGMDQIRVLALAMLLVALCSCPKTCRIIQHVHVLLKELLSIHSNQYGFLFGSCFYVLSTSSQTKRNGLES